MTARGPHSERTRARISHGLRRYYDRKRREAEVKPQDLTRLRASGTVPVRLVGFLEGAEVEAERLLEALGGPDRASPQRRALVEDVARLGLVLRAELARYVQAGDSDAAARVGTLANARRASLVALGLDRAAKPVPDLRTYLAEKAREKPPTSANGGDPDPEPAPAGERPTAAHTAPDPSEEETNP